MAESRIIDVDYDSKLIRHMPNRNFKNVRYCIVYALKYHKH